MSQEKKQFLSMEKFIESIGWNPWWIEQAQGAQH